jgi:hypothetical protein
MGGGFAILSRSDCPALDECRAAIALSACLHFLEAGWRNFGEWVMVLGGQHGPEAKAVAQPALVRLHLKARPLAAADSVNHL